MANIRGELKLVSKHASMVTTQMEQVLKAQKEVLDEMKTSTEYRKRKHMIAHDEEKQTEEIELRKLRKSSVKVFKHTYEPVHNTVMRK